MDHSDGGDWGEVKSRDCKVKSDTNSMKHENSFVFIGGRAIARPYNPNGSVGTSYRMSVLHP
jgi:hypothetical protein